MLSYKYLLVVFFLEVSIGISGHFTEGHHHHHHRRRVYYAVPGNSQVVVQQQKPQPSLLPLPIIPMSFKFPRPPAIVDVNNIVRLHLFTRQNPYSSQEIGLHTAVPLSSTNFRNTRGTKVLIHGFVDSATDATSGEWINQMREAYLSAEDVNVIVMDYSIVALFLFYWTNLPQLSAEILARNVLKLNESGAPLESFHFVGRSWGAHVAGMAGHKLSGKIGRVTGLDPANPPFHTGDFQYRLDKTDAKFVDVYHLNGKNRFLILNVVGISDKYDGLSQPFGSVDIYPNYKERQATGCPIHNATLYTESCRLGLGARLFMETIKRPSAFPVCFCESFLKYLRGECECTARNTIFMGEHMPPATTGIYQMSDLSWIDTVMGIQSQASTEQIPILNPANPESSSPSSVVPLENLPAASTAQATITTTTTTTATSATTSTGESSSNSSTTEASSSSSSSSSSSVDASSSSGPASSSSVSSSAPTPVPPPAVSEDGQSVSSEFIPKRGRQEQLKKQNE